MHETLWQEFIFKQSPLIVVLIFVAYFMYKYFTAQAAKDRAFFVEQMTELKESIDKKDTIILNQNESLRTLTVQTNGVLISLQKSFDEFRNDLKHRQ